MATFVFDTFMNRLRKDYEGAVMPETTWDNYHSDPITDIQKFVEQQLGGGDMPRASHVTFRVNQGVVPCGDYELISTDPSRDEYVLRSPYDRMTYGPFNGAQLHTMSEGGDMGNGQERSSLGSYAYALKCLAEGLPLAVDAGYLSEDEAKREFRSKVHVVESDKQQADYVKRLEDQLAEARSELGS